MEFSLAAVSNQMFQIELLSQANTSRGAADLNCEQIPTTTPCSYLIYAGQQLPLQVKVCSVSVLLRVSAPSALQIGLLLLRGCFDAIEFVIESAVAADFHRESWLQDYCMMSQGVSLQRKTISHWSILPSH